MQKQNGFTITEILVTLVITSLVMAGMVQFFLAAKTSSAQQENLANLAASLRIAMTRISDETRNTNFGVPDTGLVNWVDWVPGFNTSPLVTDGGGTAPDTITTASATSQAVAALTADASVGDTTLDLDDVSELDTANLKLILIDYTEHAHVTAIAGNTITIDTDLATGGNQGLTKNHASGTLVYRVDAKTFSVDAVNNALQLEKYHGDGTQTIVNGIGNLQIDTITAGTHYRFTLTGQSENTDPDTNAVVTRILASEITLKN